MGWIKRNWFWYTHHNLCIEPTEEQKHISGLSRKITRQKLMTVTAMLMALNEQ